MQHRPQAKPLFKTILKEFNRMAWPAPPYLLYPYCLPVISDSPTSTTAHCFSAPIKVSSIYRILLHGMVSLLYPPRKTLPGFSQKTVLMMIIRQMRPNQRPVIFWMIHLRNMTEFMCNAILNQIWLQKKEFGIKWNCTASWAARPSRSLSSNIGPSKTQPRSFAHLF